MIVDLQNLRCKRCAETSKRGPGKPDGKILSFAPKETSNIQNRSKGETRPGFALAAATTFYSFVLFKFLGVLTFCAT